MYLVLLKNTGITFMYPVLKSGDLLIFTALGPHVCPPIVAPLPLIGTSSQFLNSAVPTCLDGDEVPLPIKAILSSMPYISPPFVIPGMGKINFKLPASYLAKKLKIEGKSVIIFPGIPFKVEMQVIIPAMQPMAPSPIPDPVMSKSFMVAYTPLLPQVLAQ